MITEFEEAPKMLKIANSEVEEFINGMIANSMRPVIGDTIVLHDQDHNAYYLTIAKLMLFGHTDEISIDIDFTLDGDRYMGGESDGLHLLDIMAKCSRIFIA